MKKSVIIDLVEGADGVYQTPTAEMKIPAQRKRKEKPPIVEMIEGYQRGAKTMNDLFKIFGAL